MITVEPILLDVNLSVEEYNVEVDDGGIYDAELGSAIVINQIGGDPYEGPYTVTPKVTEQTLETLAHTMTDNVTVLEIPYIAVSNPSGGTTVTIGGI